MRPWLAVAVLPLFLGSTGGCGGATDETQGDSTEEESAAASAHFAKASFDFNTSSKTVAARCTARLAGRELEVHVVLYNESGGGPLAQKVEIRRDSLEVTTPSRRYVPGRKYQSSCVATTLNGKRENSFSDVISGPAP